MSEEIRISITEIAVFAGKTVGFKLDVDGNQVAIPIDEQLFANYQNQFWRANPTAQQRQKFGTLMSLLRAAYKKGLKDGSKSSSPDRGPGRSGGAGRGIPSGR